MQSGSENIHILICYVLLCCYNAMIGFWRGGEQSQAVRADKDVFLELADMVGDESLE